MVVSAAVEAPAAAEDVQVAADDCKGSRGGVEEEGHRTMRIGDVPLSSWWRELLLLPPGPHRSESCI